MGAATSAKRRIGLIAGGLFLVFLSVLFLLARHPEAATLLTTLPNPGALACAVRCLGWGPFLQVLGEIGRGLILIVMSGSLLLAAIRTGLRIARTWSLLERIDRKAVRDGGLGLSSFPRRAVVFEDPRPLAFTAGLLKPRIYLSTKLVENSSPDELRLIVLHETHHQKARDPLKYLGLWFISDFLFFLPLSRFLHKAFRLEAEAAADAGSVELPEDPLTMAGLLLESQKLEGLQASWFFDPTAERVKRLLGEKARIVPSFKTLALAGILLALTAFITLVPLKRNLVSLFIHHDQTCVLRTGHQ